MVAIEIHSTSYSILELLSDDVELGDVLSWKQHYDLGSTRIRNVTQSRDFEGFFQNHDVLPGQLQGQLLL
jgi:hypothetical protein